MDTIQQAGGDGGGGGQEEPSRKVPVLRTENSLIRDEFDSLRGRFDEEMRQMEEEMARFRSQMVSSFEHRQRASQRLASESKTSTKKTTTTTTSSRISSSGRVEHLESRPLDGATLTAPMIGEREQEVGTSTASAVGGPGNWIENFVNSPLIVDSVQGGGEKLLKLRFDVSAYEPDKIVVKTLDNRLQVHAEREQVGESRSTFSEYNREFLMPAGVDPEAISSTLSADGILTIEAPLPARP